MPLHRVPNIVAGPASNLDNSDHAQLLETARLLAENQSQGRLPLPEPGIFSADLLQYPLWAKAFETLIESRAVKPCERLHFLGKYVKGDAKELVNGFLLLDSEDAYEKAKAMIAKRYADPFAVADAYRKKIDSWSKIPPNDGIGLREYADFLIQCEKAMEKIGNLRALNDDQENRKIASKLPKWAVDRWSRIVYQWKTNKGTFPSFSEFVKFLSKEADIACDPVVSAQSFREEVSKKSNEEVWRGRTRFDGRRRPYSPSSLHKANVNKVQRQGVRSQENKHSVKTCLLCKGNHGLDKCEEFLRKEVRARKEYVTENRLCFARLEPGHLSRLCTRRKTCEVCGRLHPTPFHGDFKRQEERASSTIDSSINTDQPSQGDSATVCASGQGDSYTSSMIVPVWVYRKENSGHKVLVYALLDDQSDTTFVDEDVMNQLGVQGQQTQLLLSTMHAKDRPFKTQKVNGLFVEDFGREVVIPLPKTFSSPMIPA